MNPSGNRLQRHDTRQELLNQGVALIMEHGYHGTGLQVIVKTVGVPKGSFYNYFASKEAFTAEVIAHYLAPFIARLDAQLQRPDINALQALTDYFQALIEEASRQGFRGGCLLGNLMGELGESSEASRKALRHAVLHYRDKLTEAISRGQKEACIRGDIPAETLASLLLDSWQGALLRMKIEQSAEPLRGCCRLLLDQYFKP